MASGPITSWQIDGETTETVIDLIFLVSKIIVDADCRHEIKGRLLLGRKAMTNLCVCVHAQLLSHVLLCATPETAAHPWDSPGKNTGVGDTTLITESEDKLKSLLMKVKEESEKAGLKLNTQKTKIMASGPITSWEIDEETVEIVSDFLGSKITADGDCSHEIKRRLLLGRKVMSNLDSIFKSRDIICQQCPSSQGYGFSSGHVWM